MIALFVMTLLMMTLFMMTLLMMARFMITRLSCIVYRLLTLLPLTIRTSFLTRSIKGDLYELVIVVRGLLVINRTMFHTLIKGF